MSLEVLWDFFGISWNGYEPNKMTTFMNSALRFCYYRWLAAEVPCAREGFSAEAQRRKHCGVSKGFLCAFAPLREN